MVSSCPLQGWLYSVEFLVGNSRYRPWPDIKPLPHDWIFRLCSLYWADYPMQSDRPCNPPSPRKSSPAFWCGSKHLSSGNYQPFLFIDLYKKYYFMYDNKQTWWMGIENQWDLIVLFDTSVIWRHCIFDVYFTLIKHRFIQSIAENNQRNLIKCIDFSLSKELYNLYF